MELEEKYLVLKRADIEAALMDYQKEQLNLICYDIRMFRTSQGKSDNAYVIINQDEPYFPDVLKLMEQAEQAPLKAEETARRRSQGAKDGWEIRRGKQR